MTFQQKLDRIVKKNNSLVCVGLDSDIEKIPRLASLAQNYKSTGQFSFNKSIIEATYDLVCSYKLNTAFYEAIGHKGIKELKKTCDYLREKHPEIPIIIDAKRGDIGNTNNGYVQFVFTYLNADAMTVNPYLGKEAIRPFLEMKDKGIIVLCRTSNPGANEFQDLNCHMKPIYKIVAEKVAKKWNKNNNCMLVVGATYPKELAQIRKLVGDLTFLIPGIGAQGGDIEATVRAGINSKKSGMIINSARAIIFASLGRDFAKKAREKTLKLRDDINKYR